MKRTILLTTIVLMVSAATAVVGGPKPGEGEMAITSTGSSASGSTAVGPNGTQWSSQVEMQGRNPNISIGNKVENVSYSENKTTFSGYIQAPTPCHVIDQQTEQLDSESYRMSIQTIKDNSDNQCVQQVVMIKYDAEFEAGTPYNLEVQHKNRTIETLKNTASGEETEGKEKSIFDSFFDWVNSLF